MILALQMDTQLNDPCTTLAFQVLSNCVLLISSDYCISFQIVLINPKIGLTSTHPSIWPQNLNFSNVMLNIMLQYQRGYICSLGQKNLFSNPPNQQARPKKPIISLIGMMSFMNVPLVHNGLPKYLYILLKSIQCSLCIQCQLQKGILLNISK
jgi:hypothetical protein